MRNLGWFHNLIAASILEKYDPCNENYYTITLGRDRPCSKFRCKSDRRSPKSYFSQMLLRMNSLMLCCGRFSCYGSGYSKANKQKNLHMAHTKVFRMNLSYTGSRVQTNPSYTGSHKCIHPTRARIESLILRGFAQVNPCYTGLHIHPAQVRINSSSLHGFAQINPSYTGQH